MERELALLASRARSPRAVELWRRVVAANPQDTAARCNLAALLPPEEAVEAYEAVVLMSPPEDQLEACHSNLAGLYVRLGQPARALEHCVGGREGRYNQNVALRQLGRQAEAVDASWEFVGRPKALVGRTVVCVKWGKKYDAGYVNRLYRAVSRHTDATRFVCFTDDARDVDAECKELPPQRFLRGWWLKAYLFSSEAGLEGRVLYVDLDTVVLGPLDEFFEVKTSSACVLGTDSLANERRDGGYNSSLMLWVAGNFGGLIYDLLSEDFFATLANAVYKFDHWLEMLFDDLPTFQDRLPGRVVDYVEDRLPPAGASIVVFPLHPKPHDLVDQVSWVRDNWR
ncbi:hypothetical protein CTAYLR_001711 [Chrysophaeum taylorii]|uniref:Uncharacterized protein n=1 Tax=Chrysophaeum taylorii TaxID=2483200 RepID=A0AAD7U5E0_9STRA|nr:hypothetical protein CTAYLR_001711 [Chrysophaeum taylorii]